MIRAFATVFVVLGLSSIASAQPAVQFICKEVPKQRWDAKQTLILTQLGTPEELREGVEYPFQVQVFDSHTTEPVVTSKVTVMTEDVVVDFRSADERVSGTVYLDELDQASLTVNGVTRRFDCR